MRFPVTPLSFIVNKSYKSEKSKFGDRLLLDMIRYRLLLLISHPGHFEKVEEGTHSAS